MNQVLSSTRKKT